MQMRQLTQEEWERVEANTGLVNYVVKRFVTQYSIEYDDYFSAGKFGLCKASMTFAEGKGYAFATYAIRVIENEILMYIRSNGKHLGVASLNYVIYDNNRNKTSLQDIIPDESTLPVEENAVYKEELEKTLNIILNEITGKRRAALLLSISGMTQSEIGKRLNVSQSYASRLVDRARKILMQKLSTESTFGKQELFSVKVEVSEIRICFPCEIISDTEREIRMFLASNEESRRKAEGEISISGKRVMIKLNMEAEALEFLAEFLFYFGLQF